jgi:SSS family solute:Na+ symporter
MRPLAVGLSLFATLFSTISYLAWPGEMIKNGPMVLSMIVAYPLVAIVAGWFMIPYIMKLKITSAYELLETRLGLSVRMLGSTLFLLLRLLWMATIVYATADAVLVPLMGVDSAWTPWVSTVLGLVTLIYTAMGGMKAVVVTDVLQGLILFFGAVVALVLITYEMGGIAAWWPTHWAAHWTEPVFYDPNIRISFLSASLATFTWYIATTGSDQMAIQRYLATRDAPAARRVLNTSLVADAVVFLLLSSLGLALLAYFTIHPELLAPGQSLVEHADELLTRFIVVGMPPGLSGLVVAGLLAAAMSSLSAGINSCCSVITVDYVDRFGLRRPDAAGTRRATLEPVISVLVGVVVLVLSTYVSQVEGNLLDKAYKVVNLLSTPLFGLFFMAMFVRWATALGTWGGAAVGVGFVVAINYWEEITGTKGISFFWAMPISILAQIAVGTALSALPIGVRAYQRAKTQ